MVEEKIIRINLRKWIIKKPRWKRNKLLIKKLREKLQRILHSEKVLLDQKISQKVFSSSKPDPKFTLKITKEDDKYKVELIE